MEASKKLSPLMKHGLLPLNWKLLVYRSVVQSILMYAMDSLLLTPGQLTKMDSVHYKCLRRIFKIKSSYYHRVISPSSLPCSNQYLAEPAFSSRRVISPSQIYSQNRLNLLGHLYRHPDSLESQATFMPSAAYRHTRGANRVGRPKPHWAESCLVEASRRINLLHSDRPLLTFRLIMNFTPFRDQQISVKHMPHTPWYGWTTLLFIAKYLLLPEIELLGFRLLINQAVNPRSVLERSEQTGPNLGPALAKKKQQKEAAISFLAAFKWVLILCRFFFCFQRRP